MPDGDSDDALTRAIGDRISSLQQERDGHFATINKKLCDPRAAAYFIEEFERLGGPEAAKTLKKAGPIAVLIGRIAREDAPIGTGEVAKPPVPPSTQRVSSKTASMLPVLRETMSSIAMENPNTMIDIMDRAEAISPPYLLHFTQVENISSIMRNGLCPVATLTAATTPFRANDHLRLDGHKDAVSLSIAHPNDRMFFKYRRQDPKQKWAVLVLDPAVLWAPNCVQSSQRCG
jgi:hypothetical protein